MHLASSQPQEDLLESLFQDQSGSFWSTEAGWDNTSLGDLFFDQVAELEKLVPVENGKEIISQNCCCIKNAEYHDAGGVAGVIAKDQENMTDDIALSKSLDTSSVVDSFGNGITREMKEGSRDASLQQLSVDTGRSDWGEQDFDLSSVPNVEAALLYDFQSSPCSVGSSCSDEAVEKRLRNNKASRKFRRARKERHNILFTRASELEHENHALKLQVNEMMKEISTLRSLLPPQFVQ